MAEGGAVGKTIDAAIAGAVAGLSIAHRPSLISHPISLSSHLSLSFHLSFFVWLFCCVGQGRRLGLLRQHGRPNPWWLSAPHRCCSTPQAPSPPTPASWVNSPIGALSSLSPAHTDTH
jgi:hypothetical protein